MVLHLPVLVTPNFAFGEIVADNLIHPDLKHLKCAPLWSLWKHEKQNYLGPSVQPVMTQTRDYERSDDMVKTTDLIPPPFLCVSLPCNAGSLNGSAVYYLPLPPCKSNADIRATVGVFSVKGDYGIMTRTFACRIFILPFEMFG